MRDGPDEQSNLIHYLAEQHGLTIFHADPTELRVEGDEVWYEDVCVDVVDRDYETRDLIAMEKQIGGNQNGEIRTGNQNGRIRMEESEWGHTNAFFHSPFAKSERGHTNAFFHSPFAIGIRAVILQLA